MSAKPVIYLIDGSSQMYRAFHAPVRTAEGTLLSNAQGQPTNAVYIFVTMLRKLLKEHTLRYVAASFDLPGRTFRDDLAADYKANRAPMPDQLAAQIPLVHRACEALGVPIINVERYEADDVIGTMAMRAVAAGCTVVIVTGDKDFFQLVGPEITVFNPRDEGTWYDEAGVREKFGVPPGQVLDVLALMGDAIDNVRGVPGIGEKGARDLIAVHGSLDTLLSQAAAVPQKKYREALLAHADQARHSRELLRIHTDVQVAFDLLALAYRGPSRSACYELFSELGFRSLVAEYAPTADSVEKDYRLVTLAADLEALVDEVERARRFSLHVVVDDSTSVRAKMAGLAVATSSGRARYVPLGHLAPEESTGSAGREGQSPIPDLLGPDDTRGSTPVVAPSLVAGRSQLSLADALHAFRGVLENPRLEKVGHDLKADIIALARHQVDLKGVGDDAMLASYLLDPTRSSHQLEGLALDYIGYKALTRDDISGRGSKAVQLRDLAPEAVLTYAGERADLALQLADRLSPLLVSEQLDGLYSDLEKPLIPVLAAMELAGVRVDPLVLGSQAERTERELVRLSRAIYELAGESFNINSPPQLSKILFDKLQLPTLRRNAKTRTASTSVEVLEELALSHDLPRLILEWRALQKLKNTYIDALPQLIDPRTGRVHTSFNQAVAATGRLSSSDPNLQNIPIRTELGREIRRAFVADPGHVLISADYSQIELRVLAHLAADETLIAAFRNGVDIHDQTALKTFGPASGLDRHELRRRAKIINYALLYGKTAFTLAKDIGVTQEAAQRFIEAYFSGFPRVREFIDRTLADARATGVVKTMYGRRRFVPEVNSRNGQVRAATERAAVNLPIQGTAADIMKRAMIDVHAALGASEGARMILTVHDELLFEVPRSRADEVAALVREKMERAAVLQVPLTVDVGIGENWKDAKS